MKRLAFACSLTMAAALSFELACRIEDRIRYGMPMLSDVRDQDDLVVRDAAGAHGRPGAQYQQFVLNNFGMRGPQLTLAKPPATLRVATIGASETFGLYESIGHEYPRQLESMLRATLAGRCAPDRSERVEVINAAIFGMSMPTAEQDLRLRVAAMRPDVVVAYPTPPHYLDDERPRAARPDSSVRHVVTPVSRRLHPRALDRLREQAKALLPGSVSDWLRRRQTRVVLGRHTADWRWTSIPEDRLAAYETDLRTLVGTMRALGATPILVTHGNAFPPNRPRDATLLTRWERFYPRATGATIVAFDSAARYVTLRVAKDSGIVAIDAQRIMHDRMAGDDRRFFEEYAHFTDAGAGMLASLISEAVSSEWKSRGTPTCTSGPGVVAAGTPR